MHNLSSFHLPPPQLKLLSLGLDFIPPPQPIRKQQLIDAVVSLDRTYRLKYFFRNSTNIISPFRIPNPSWNPPAVPEITQTITSITSALPSPPTIQPRPHRNFRTALHNLKNNQDIVIKPADKNLGTCILSKDWYLNECLRQLNDKNTYTPVKDVPLETLHSRLEHLCLKASPHLSNEEIRFLLQKPKHGFRICRFYIIPKIHKPIVVGRPICAYNNYVFERASKWLHHLLHPVLLSKKQHLKDSLTLVKDLAHHTFPKTCTLFSFDVVSLYPSIPTTEGLLVFKKSISHHFPPHKTKIIMSVAELILRNNFLSFNNAFWLQIKGTAMGSNFAVVYACLFLSQLEDDNLAFQTPQLLYYKRYIDDAIGVWEGSPDTLHTFLHQYGVPLQQHIRIESTTSPKEITILDVVFFKGPYFKEFGILDTACHQKPLNAYMYLPWKSSHPIAHKKGFITGELKRYAIRESSENGYMELRKKFYDRLRARGYPSKFLLKCFSTVPYSIRNQLLSNQPNNKKPPPIVFKLRYSPCIKKLQIGALVRNKLKPLLGQPQYSSLTPPLTCWLNGKKLRNHLVHSSFPPT